MKLKTVKFVQSGGILGSIRGCELRTEHLAPDTARELEQLVEASGISAACQSLSDTGRDLQQYEITIEDKDSKRSAVFDDKTLPPAARPLVHYLKSQAKPWPPER